MKKYLIALMVFVLALTLVACSGETETTEHVHAFAEEIVPATCTTPGKVLSKCECGEIESENEIPTTDHVASALDCEKDTVCTVCNAVLAEKTGHVFGAKEIVTAATCAAPGKEQGTCTVCGKISENEIPSTGHVIDAKGTIAAVDGGFSITCASCNQPVVLKESDPAFKLTFDGAATDIDVNSLGLELVNADKWSIQEHNGSKALCVDGTAQIAYINIPSAKKLADMGAFVISFDYMSTKKDTENRNASVFSILGNFYNGNPLVSNNAVKWGWAIKLVEANNVLATKNSTDTDATNSIALERNVVYKVQIVFVPETTAKHVFINGTYIGDGGQGVAISTAADNYLCFRFGDGPMCGHVYDNFIIADLK